MRNDRSIIHALLTASLLFSSGCSALTGLVKRKRVVVQQEQRSYRIIPLRDSENPEIIYSTIIVEEETYMQIINRQARAKAIAVRSIKRHIGIWGLLRETHQEFGVKVVFPWPND